MFYLIAARQWNHIEDLDDFFTRVYHYHQRNGFVCMVLQDVMQLMYAVFYFHQPRYTLDLSSETACCLNLLQCLTCENWPIKPKI